MSPTATDKHPEASLRTIPLSYSLSDSENSAKSLVTALNEEWITSQGPIELVTFKDGITNTLFKAIKRRPGFTDHQIDEEALLLRAYGSGTDVLIDRDREAQSHLALAENDLAPPLYARFKNGLLYKYIEGEPCSPDDLQRADVWPAIAQTLGRWHGVLPTAAATANAAEEHDKQYITVKKLVPNQPLPHLWSTMQKWINALPSDTAEKQEHNKILQSALEEAAARLAETTGLSHGSYIMAHCDLLSGNVIIKPGEGHESDGRTIADVAFIDYEYTNPAPAAFDLANHFAEYVGFDCDMNKIPCRSRRRAFLRDYAAAYRQYAPSPDSTGDATVANGASGDAHQSNGNAYHAHSESSLDDDVEQLMREVDTFRGIPGLYWGIWALIQATISTIDFDYATYATDRLGEYWAWKEESDGSRKKEGREMALRERRWGQEED